MNSKLAIRTQKTNLLQKSFRTTQSNSSDHKRNTLIFDSTKGLTQNQIEYQQIATNFGKKEFAPFASKWDEETIFPIEALQKAANLGFASMYLDEDVGGSGLNRRDGVVILEALATSCPSTAAYLSLQNMCINMFNTYANDKLRLKYLGKMIKLEALTSYCITEPEAGSDAGSLQTTAVKQGDKYILNGTKCFISGGGRSDIYLVMARTGGPGPKGISAFVVEKDTPGISFGSLERKLGWRNQPTTTVTFTNCNIPAENLLGKEGEGFKYAMKDLDGGRINIAALSLGGAQAALNATAEYVNTRKQFDKPLINNQSIQFTLADMVADLTASRLMVFEAARLLDEKNTNASVYCAMSKRFATDASSQIVNEALQLHGGYGYLKDFPIEKISRDLRVHQILEGTNEIMKMIIGRQFIQK